MSTRAPLSVARTEIRRSVRVITEDRWKLLLNLGFVVAALAPMLFVGTLILPDLGEAVAAGEIGGTTVTDVAAGGMAMLWAFALLLATIRTVTSAAKLDEPAFLLVSTSVRNVVLGVLGAQFALFAIWTVPTLLVLVGGFAYGYGSALPLALAVLVAVVVLATALPVGFVLGVWIRHLLTVYEPIARHRTPLLVALGVAYFGSIATGWFDDVVDGTYALLADSPLGWPGHVLALAVPGASPSTAALAGTAIGAVALPAVAVVVATRSAELLWFSDPARTEDDASASESSSRVADLLASGSIAAVLDRPTRAVTVTAIRRSKRAPVRLLYAVYPLFGAVGFVQQVIQTGELPVYGAVALCLYVVWGSGVLFSLNPLGDPGNALPAVLTAPISGRETMSGLVVAGALVGVPVAVVVGAVVGVLSPLSATQSGLLLAGTVLGAIAAPALATGIGTLFPRFGSVRVTNNREAVMPSKTAFITYTLAIALPALAAVVLYVDGAPEFAAVSASFLLGQLPSIDPTVSPSAVWTLAAILLPLGLVAPFASFGYAVWRYDGFTVS